jgi:hypothetical protein
MPVGIHVERELVNKDDKKLARAFQLLGIPLEGTYEPQDVAGYSIQDVQDVQDTLLGHQDGKSTIIPIFEFMDELTGNDDDTLNYSVIVPDYDYTNYAVDGVRLTNVERRQQRDKDAEGAPSSQSAPRATLPDKTDPMPPYTPHASQPHVARPSLLPIHVSTVIAQALTNEGVLSGSTLASSTSTSAASSTFSASSSSGSQQSQLYSRRAEHARLH